MAGLLATLCFLVIFCRPVDGELELKRTIGRNQIMIMKEISIEYLMSVS
jgi:hypothetical protein